MFHFLIFLPIIALAMVVLGKPQENLADAIGLSPEALLVIILITPETALGPNNGADGPLTISILSTSLISTGKASQKVPEIVIKRWATVYHYQRDNILFKNIINASKNIIEAPDMNVINTVSLFSHNQTWS